MIYSFSNTASYSTFYTFFSSADVASQQQTRVLSLSTIVTHRRTDQKKSDRPDGKPVLCQRTYISVFHAVFFFYTVKLYILTSSVCGPLPCTPKTDGVALRWDCIRKKLRSLTGPLPVHRMTVEWIWNTGGMVKWQGIIEILTEFGQTSLCTHKSHMDSPSNGQMWSQSLTWRQMNHQFLSIWSAAAPVKSQ